MIGLYRTMDNGNPVDSTVFDRSPFGSFTDDVSMLNEAVAKADSHACYVPHERVPQRDAADGRAPEMASPIIVKSMA